MFRSRVITGVGALSLALACGGSQPVSSSPAIAPAGPVSDTGPGERTDDEALALHRSAIVIDTHSDVTQRLVVEGLDLGQRHEEGHLDVLGTAGYNKLGLPGDMIPGAPEATPTATSNGDHTDTSMGRAFHSDSA